MAWGPLSPVTSLSGLDAFWQRRWLLLYALFACCELVQHVLLSLVCMTREFTKYVIYSSL